MAPHCDGWVEEFSSTELQTQILLPVRLHECAGAGTGQSSRPGVGVLASHFWIWLRLRLSACNTLETTVSTAPGAVSAFPHVAHEARAAAIAPCCAACWMVE